MQWRLLVFIPFTLLSIAIFGQPNIQVESRSAPLALVTIGLPHIESITITNTGTTNLFVTSISKFLGSSEWSEDGNSFSLSPNARRSFNIIFNPIDTGYESARFRIESNDPDEGSIELIRYASGVYPNIFVSTNNYDLGEVQIADQGTETITIRNLGPGDLNITSIGFTELETQWIEDGGPVLIPNGESTDFNLTFQPNNVGVDNAAILINSNDPDQPNLFIAAEAEGIPQQPVIEVTPTSCPLGQVGQGFQETEVFTISNSGIAPLEVSDINLIIQDGNWTLNGGPVNIDPGSSADFSVTYSAAIPDMITDIATIEIISNDLDETPFHITCSAMPVPPIPDINTPPFVDLGPVGEGNSQLQFITVSNPGAGYLQIGDITQTSGSNEWAVTNFSVPPGLLIPPKASGSFGINFTPDITGAGNVGPQSASFNISSNDPDMPVTPINLQATVTKDFEDGFETNLEWGRCDELVDLGRCFQDKPPGDPDSSCYSGDIGDSFRSMDVAYEGDYSLLVWPNMSETTKSNHIIAQQRLSYSGRDDAFRYEFYSYIAPDTETEGETGPEFSMQNTRMIQADVYKTTIAGIQYISNPTSNNFAKWQVWREDPSDPGTAGWEDCMTQPLQSGEWYLLALEADFITNRYIRLIIRGAGLNLEIDLSQYIIAEENKFEEEAFWLTLEGENRSNNCGASGVFDYKIYYDNVQLKRIVPEIEINSLTESLNTTYVGMPRRATITVENSGGLALDIQSIVLNNNGDGEFSIVDQGSLPTIVPPGASASFQVEFDPINNGSESATIEIHSNDTDEPIVTVTVTAFGYQSNGSITLPLLVNAAIPENSTSYEFLHIENQYFGSFGNLRFLITYDLLTGPDTVKTITLQIPSAGDLAWQGERLWAVSPESIGSTQYKLFELDPDDGAVLTEIPIPIFDPFGLTWDGQYFWVASDYFDLIYKIDPLSGQILFSFPSPGPKPSGLAWDGQYLWNADQQNDLVYRIDPADGSVLSSFLSPDSEVSGLAYHKFMLWINGNASGRTYEATTNGHIISSFATTLQTGDGGGMTHDGEFLWILDNDGTTITQVNNWLQVWPVHRALGIRKSRLVRALFNSKYVDPGFFHAAQITVKNADSNDPEILVDAFMEIDPIIDEDGDGIFEDIDQNPFSNILPQTFSDVGNGGATFGEIVDYGDQNLIIKDGPTEGTDRYSGVFIQADPQGGTNPANIRMCNNSAVFSIGNGEIRFFGKCGSVITEVLDGTLEAIYFGDDGSVGTATIPQGNTLEFYPSSFSFTAADSNSADIIIAVDGSDLILQPGEAQNNQAFVAGWNMIGLSGNTPDKYHLSLFPTASPNTLFSFDGVYTPEDSLKLGKGYWLNFTSDGSAAIQNMTLDSISINLSAGWNMISSASCDIALTDIIDPDNIIVENTLFGFENVYVMVDTLQAGNGYWLRTNASGTITIDCAQTIFAKQAEFPLSAALLPINDVNINALPALKITDAQGNSQTLYFEFIRGDSTGINTIQLKLPPVPPAGLFDVRFAGDFWLLEGSEGLIEIQSNAYPLAIEPLNLSGNQVDYFQIQAEVGKEVINTYRLLDGGIIQVNNPLVKKLSLSKVSKNIPSDFLLAQNYPNPFNPSTKIKYGLPTNTRVTMIIYNILGQRIKTLINDEIIEAGYHTVQWDGVNENGHFVTSGLYFVKFKSEYFEKTIKMMMLK